MKANIYPYLWFDKEAEEAAQFYTSIFPDSQVNNLAKQGEAVIWVEFYLSDQKFVAINGGPMYSFNYSTSFFVICESEEEIKQTWSLLSREGEVLMPLDTYKWSSKYGWIKDKYGLSWQLLEIWVS